MLRNKYCTVVTVLLIGWLCLCPCRAANRRSLRSRGVAVVSCPKGRTRAFIRLLRRNSAKRYRYRTVHAGLAGSAASRPARESLRGAAAAQANHRCLETTSSATTKGSRDAATTGPTDDRLAAGRGVEEATDRTGSRATSTCTANSRSAGTGTRASTRAALRPRTATAKALATSARLTASTAFSTTSGVVVPATADGTTARTGPVTERCT